MINNKNKIYISCILFGFLSLLVGCVTKGFTPAEINDALIDQQTPLVKKPSYIKLKTHKEIINGQSISFVGRIALADALRRFMPEYHLIPMDKNVKLEQEIELNAIDMPVQEFLNSIASLAGIDIKRNGYNLELSAFISREWMLGALSGGKKIKLESNASLNKGLDISENDASLSEEVSYDEWDQLINAAKAMLDEPESETVKPYVYGIRSIGKIVAGGSAQKMRRLDQYLTGLQKTSTQQIAIEVQAFDIMLNDDRGSGVNWQEFAALGSSINGNPLSLNLANSTADTGIFVSNALQAEGPWRGRVGYQSSNFTAQAVLQFLNRFGEVELLNQPNLTVRNGGFALMHAGEQLSYIAETEVVRDTGNDTVAVAAKVKQLKVGVSLAVSPKLLDDNRILLSIWPVVSSVQGFDEFFSDPIPVRVPKLALQELSTEVIVESGKSIQLGGLIRKSVSNSLQTLPFRNGITGALLRPLFNSDSQSLQRRELVIMVTPRLVN